MGSYDTPGTELNVSYLLFYFTLIPTAQDWYYYKSSFYG